MCGCRSGVFCGGLCGARWILICEGRGVSWRLEVGEKGVGEKGVGEKVRVRDGYGRDGYGRDGYGRDGYGREGGGDGYALFIYLGFFVLVDCVAEAFPEVWVAGDCHCCVCVSS